MIDDPSGQRGSLSQVESFERHAQRFRLVGLRGEGARDHQSLVAFGLNRQFEWHPVDQRLSEELPLIRSKRDAWATGRRLTRRTPGSPATSDPPPASNLGEAAYCPQNAGMYRSSSSRYLGSYAAAGGGAKHPSAVIGVLYGAPRCPSLQKRCHIASMR